MSKLDELRAAVEVERRRRNEAAREAAMWPFGLFPLCLEGAEASLNEALERLHAEEIRLYEERRAAELAARASESEGRDK